MTEVLEQNEFPCVACDGADIERAWELMTADKDKNWVAVQIAPAVRVAIGEWFGMSRGEDGIGKVVSVLKGIGADIVIDTAVSEDAVTLMEVAKLRERKARGEKFPLLSSRCVAFLQLAKEKYPEVEISDAPTASAVSADVLKEVCRAQAENKAMYVISVEPCKAAKSATGADLVLTTEELVQILDETGVNLRLVRKSVLDMPFGASAGSGYLGGKSGGSAEAVARCLLADKSEEAVKKLAYSGLYGEKARRTVTLYEGETEWKIAVASGLDEAECLLQEIQNEQADYDYVEIMACGGGCVCGDGQDCTACVGETEGARAMKLRAVGLKYLDEKRAVKSADRSASAAAIGRVWVAAQQKKALEALEAEAREAVQEAVEETLENQPVVVKLDLGDETETEPVKITIGVESGAVEEDGDDFEIEFITQEEFDAVGADAEAEEPELEIEIVEETSVEEIAEEAIEEVEETSVEEIAEEAIEEVEETPVEEVAEETAEEVEETFVEEVVEEAAEEVEETPVEEIAEETIEEVEETPVEEVAEEMIEEVEETPVEEVVEEAAEEVEETFVEEIAEETIEEVEETPVEEVAEEAVAETKEIYGGRLSKKDRRKLKRMKKNENKSADKEVEEAAEEAVEAITEETVEEVVEEKLEELSQEVVTEIVEEVVEEISEEVTEEITDEIIEEVIEEVVEEIVEEVIEEVVEEIVEEVIEETAEEAMEEVAATEEAIEEAPVEEIMEEIVVEETMTELAEESKVTEKPYYARLSGKDRRKMKRKNKGK